VPIDRLLDLGVSPDRKDRWDTSPIHGLVQWLLDRGANANARSSIGSRGTALHSAAWNGNLPMVKLLVAAGADIDVRDEEHHNTPAGFAEVAITVSNNPRCKDVVDYLAEVRDRSAPLRP
jgi:hypothetical protein